MQSSIYSIFSQKPPLGVQAFAPFSILLLFAEVGRMSKGPVKYHASHSSGWSGRMFFFFQMNQPQVQQENYFGFLNTQNIKRCCLWFQHLSASGHQNPGEVK